MALQRKNILLTLLILINILSLAISYRNKKTVKTTYYEIQIESRKIFEAALARIRQYKKNLDIELSEYDILNTGLIGEEQTGITTTLGNLKAKRTAVNPDIAPMIVKMYHELNLKPGDKIAFGLSGSFPGLNIAVISAAQAMNLDAVIISSVGSSTYGANNTHLTFPEILDNLYNDRILNFNSSLVTPGGAGDIGSDMNADMLAAIFDRYQKRGLHIMIEDNFSKNIKNKIALFNAGKKPDCFVAVGGNITFKNSNEAEYTEQGILKKPHFYKTDDANIGLINYYIRHVPVIHLLNIKKIVSDYGLTYDPVSILAYGKSSVYYATQYSKLPLISSLLFSLVLILLFKTDKK
ncbi:poly-gamma-glutamate system protein [Treponema phagedenis]|uniref:poly-gamma-glutamate system protein n=1 Tax=Treponema phagedenis TaxID=162 RepID=UPI00198095B2|nr:poly-gamma-glutamate system protein [Treponema phagedenis]QSH93495.1 hypothetical protein C5O78_00200 [Treponema phagedenis]